MKRAAKGDRPFTKRPAAKRIAKGADGEAVEKTAGNPEPAAAPAKEPRKAAPRKKPAAEKKEVKSLSEIKKSDAAPAEESK